ncbi:proton-coupled amino acid transporter-like protein pathetic [Photinus pyralis]|uniref:Amino acid transporter transmembrane domain-containing protein n=1 Tax=Photinus pyralis TaxID=7054 RepID=A0A1Y1LSA3_PHOPY|nr:proton-coupled amino acid transporter-like protein pathetic [Photinus pyralis]
MSKENKKYQSTLTIDDFSSTTKLATHEITVPIGSKESISETDSYYNPFEHRSVEHPNSTTGALIHLLKSSLGTGILAMPNAFRNAGLIFGLVGTFVVGLLCTYCVHILVKASHAICQKAKIPVLGFSETCGAAFEYGPKPLRKFSTAAKYTVDISLLITYFMSNCVYVVFIAEALHGVFNQWFPDNGLSIRMYMVMIMGFLIISAQIRELKHLVPFSFLANVSLVGALGVTLYYMFLEVNPVSSRPAFASFSTLPMFFSTVIFAMEGIGVVMPVENNMKNPQHFLGCPGVLNAAMTSVVLLYAFIGFFGYLRFGEDTRPNITLNLPMEEIPAQIGNVLIPISVFLTYNLQMFVPLDIIWRKGLSDRLHGTWRRHLGQIIMRCLYVAGTIAVSVAVPNLEPIIGLVGSVCFSTLGILVPAIVDTVLNWEGDLGFMKWKLIRNIILAIFAIFALVSGTSQSIGQIINPPAVD